MEGSDRGAPPLAIRLLGPFDVRLHGAPLPRLRSRKGPWLLALLVLRHSREVERAWLAGTLWPDSTERDAFVNLRQSLTDLRRALGAEAGRLRSPTPHTLALNLCGAEVDLLTFDAALARGDTASLEEAISLYRGPLLEGCAEEWVLQEREVREQASLTALEELAAQTLAEGNAGAAEGYLRRAVVVEPLRESAQRALMEALAVGGSYAAAIEVYRDLRLRLHREVHAEPDAQTTALYEQIRAEARAKAAGGRGPDTRLLEAREGDGVEQQGAHSRVRAGIPARAAAALLPEGVVTFLFTDIEGSTRLWEEHPEAMRLALARHDALAAAIIPDHAGALLKSRGEGDSLFAVFARPSDAVAAACALQQALLMEVSPTPIALRVRMALHTGEADLRESDYYGPAVNRCARLRAAAHGGQILLSQPTCDLTRDSLPNGAHLRDLGERRLKDLIQPEHIFQLLHPGLPVEFPPLATLDACPNNLPAQPTPLIGRETEIEAARRLLQREEVRLLTLTGPGGTGKTRLGLQVAADLLDDFQDGVFYVDLAPIQDPGLVASAIAQTLGVRESGSTPLVERLKGQLRGKQLLLVLDNFEQILEAAPLVAELLAAAPGLKILLTSRAGLHLRGEQEFAVPPLAVPDSRLLSPDALTLYPSVELFLQRAVNVKVDFTLTEENAPAVAEICRRLDGLPLALELAAARVKLFPPQALLMRLERRLELLTGGARDLPARQQTLRNAIAWSYNLLEEGEKLLFRRLSVFVGGFTLEAADAVCIARADAGCPLGATLEIDVLEGIMSLLDKSLLRPEPGTDDAPRFGMFETIREYSRECLAASGEEESLRRQHAEFFAALAEEAEPGFQGAERPVWLARLEAEHDNLRAALEWSQSARSPLALQLVGALGWFWHFGGYYKEGCRRAQSALDVDTERTTERGRALWVAGLLAWIQGDLRGARSQLEQSARICRELGDHQGLGRALRELGNVLWFVGDRLGTRRALEESVQSCRQARSDWDLALTLAVMGFLGCIEGDDARAAAEESHLIFRRLGDDWGRAAALFGLGVVFGRRGEYTPARSYLEEAVALLRAEREPWSTAEALGFLGEVVELQEERERAMSLYAESLALSRGVGDPCCAATVLYNLGAAAQRRGRPGRAARLFAAAETLGGPALGRKPTLLATPAERERSSAALRAALGEEAFAAAWAEGHSMTLDQAAGYALEEDTDG
jgi:predicted ATPase/class 3 adenylate cyclase